MSSEIKSRQEILGRLIPICKSKNIELVGFKNEIKYLYSTEVNLYCPTHNNFWTASAALLVKGQGNCKICTHYRKLSMNKIDDHIHIDKFMKTGGYLDGTTFKRLTQKQMWEITCPICSVDNYVTMGLCSGKFRVGFGSLIEGRKPCRCHIGFRWTKPQREFQIKNTFQEEGLNYEFLKWVSEKHTGATARITINCKDHGVFEPYLDTYLNCGTRCPSCAKSGFNVNKDAYLYVIKTTKFTGYGVTCDLKHRLSVHRKNLKRNGDSIEEFEFIKTTGTSAIEIEKLIKSKFNLYKNEIIGFKTEATFLENYSDVLELVHANSPQGTYFTQ